MPVRPFGSTTASRFAPVAAASMPVARCTSTTRFSLPRPAISTPLRDCYVPRDQSINRVCCLPVHLTNPPDFLSLPAARPNKSLGCGSPFQVRYVSAGLLFLKPLGTSFTMLPMCLSVNVFWDGIGSFPQHLYFLFSIVYMAFPAHLLWIKRSRRVVILRYCNRKCAGL